jgi:hypothetical protein
MIFQRWWREDVGLRVEGTVLKSPVTWITISRRKFIKEHEAFCLRRVGFLCSTRMKSAASSS